MVMNYRANYRKGTCFNPDKRRWGDREQAQKAADKMTAKRGVQMAVYECGNHFHLTKAR